MVENMIEQEYTSEYSPVGRFNLKLGAYSVGMNIVVGALMIVCFVIMFIIFPVLISDTYAIMWTLFKIFGGLSLFIAGVLICFLVKYIFFKANAAGSIKLHFGLAIEIYSEMPIKRLAYFLSDIVGIIMLLIVFGVLMGIFWNVTFFIAFWLTVVNFLGNVPVLVFVLRRPPKSYIIMESGVLCAYTKNEIRS